MVKLTNCFQGFLSLSPNFHSRHNREKNVALSLRTCSSFSWGSKSLSLEPLKNLVSPSLSFNTGSFIFMLHLQSWARLGVLRELWEHKHNPKVNAVNFLPLVGVRVQHCNYFTSRWAVSNLRLICPWYTCCCCLHSMVICTVVVLIVFLVVSIPTNVSKGVVYFHRVRLWTLCRLEKIDNYLQPHSLIYLQWIG